MGGHRGRFEAALVIGVLGTLGPWSGAYGAYPPPPPNAIQLTPVSFRVHNTNTSKAPCLPDDDNYTVRGTLVLPASDPAGSVTVYLHGAGIGNIWHFPVSGHPEVDYVMEQARSGHASLVFDELGFGASDIPDGNDVCDGSWADMADQVIRALRDRNYMSTSNPVPRFDRIALAGISGGGRIAEILAYSYPADIDALIVSGWAEQIPNGGLGPVGARWGSRCATGGEPKRVGAPSGYAFLLDSRDEVSPWMFNADGDVVTAVAAAWERDSCGDAKSIGTAVLADQIYLPTIAVPVLLTYGDHDVFVDGSGSVQRARFTGSSDVSLAVLPDSGHIIMLGRTAALYRHVVGSWLGARGF